MSCKESAALVAPLVNAQSVAAAANAMTTSIHLSITDDSAIPLTATDIVEQVNVVRESADAAITTMRAALGVQANSQIESLRQLIEAMTRFAEVAISLDQNPRVFVVEKLVSARQLVFSQFGSQELLEKFTDLNPQLRSINFIEPGTEVSLPRSQ